MKKGHIFVGILILLIVFLVAFLIMRNVLPAIESERPDESWESSWDVIIDEELLNDIYEDGSVEILPDGVIVFRPVESGADETTENPGGATEEPVSTEETNPVLDSAIVGEWYRWSKSIDSFVPEFGIVKYQFGADGIAYDEGGYYVMNALEIQRDSAEPRSLEYTFDGSVLTIDGVRKTARISGDKLIITEHGRENVYVRGDFDDAIADILAKHFDYDIVGTWYYIEDGTTPPGEYIIWEITFTKDQIFRETSYDYYADVDKWGESGVVKEKTYFYDGELLYRDFDKTTALIENGVLRIKSPYGNDYDEYCRGDVKDAIEYIRETFSSPEPQPTQPAETEPPVIDPAILGTWRDVWAADKETMRYAEDSCWEFNADGTFMNYGQESYWYYSAEEGLIPDDDALGSGSRLMSGTYTFDGSTLALTYTMIEYDDSTELPFTQTHQISISNDEIQWGDKVLYKGSMLEVAQKLLGS